MQRARLGPAESSERQLVLAAASLMVALHLGFRAWALYPSWFYLDDYRLLGEASTTQLTWRHLVSPYDSQFMPLGRGLVWLVAHSGHVNWNLVATLVLAQQLAADAACLWMLFVAFGRRWGVLVPLGLYQWLAVTVPGQMWWAASLNQMPLQISFFGAVASWLGYARTRQLRWLALTMCFLLLGLTAYVKTALVFGVLAYLLLAYFARGGPLRRTLLAVRRYWPSLLAVGSLGLAFAAYFSAHVPSLFQPVSATAVARLANSMLATSLVTGLLGGPWRWDHVNPPVVGAHPPAWAVHLSWAVLAVIVIGIALRRARTGRAWALLAAYVAATFILLMFTRAPQVGGIVGYQYRYLTDVIPVAALCVGLATMELRGACGTSEPREQPLLTKAPSPRLVVLLVSALFLSGVVSTIRYVRVWHVDNPSDTWAHNAIDGLRGRGTVDLANQVVPEDVMQGFAYPDNTTARLVPLLLDNARFPDYSTRLVVLDDLGHPRRAEIDAATTGRAGRAPGCGWQLKSGSTTIPMEQTAFDFDWWVRISFLGSSDDTMSVTIAGKSHNVPIRKGAQSIFVHVNGEIPSVTLGGLSAGTTVCVDTVEVGVPVVGAML